MFRWCCPGDQTDDKKKKATRTSTNPLLPKEPASDQVAPALGVILKIVYADAPTNPLSVIRTIIEGQYKEVELTGTEGALSYKTPTGPLVSPDDREALLTGAATVSIAHTDGKSNVVGDFQPLSRGTHEDFGTDAATGASASTFAPAPEAPATAEQARAWGAAIATWLEANPVACAAPAPAPAPAPALA